ncbi:MAG TPA: 50S ribosomal protein L3 [Candidatus Limnocylindrales bacterium]|nr:50S ribosomal protein L3 [Candidatus Limnocylindrales bacterium]
MLGLVGKKIGMTQRFVEGGNLVPVTVIETGPCTVVQVRTTGTDGYEALQVGFGTRREKNLSKAVRGHMNKGGRATFASLLEFRLREPGEYQVGQEIRLADLFKVGDQVDVSGTSKGKGFQGVMKRHNFGGHRATHGTHESFRGPGSIGCRSYPGRVFKGKRMDGHMGAETCTTQNLRIVEVRADENLLMVKGAIPGAPGSQVVVKPAVKRQRTQKRVIVAAQ